jgi:hypothetical protein
LKERSMTEFRFNVFGTRIAIMETKTGWTPYFLGPDGKRRQADFVVPSFIEENDLAQYLGDLFHESATPANNKVTRIR